MSRPNLCPAHEATVTVGMDGVVRDFKDKGFLMLALSLNQSS
jgi:hypothetical protein